MNATSPLHLWVPGIQSNTGGIQAYSNFFVRAIAESYPSVGKYVLIKNEKERPAEENRPANTAFQATGRTPESLRTAAFAARGLLSLVKEHPQLILATHPNFTRALCRFKAWRSVPYVSVLHGVDAWDIDSPSLIKGLRESDRLLSVSQFTKDKLIAETGIDESKIAVVPNTFDHERFQIAPKPPHLLERYGLEPGQPVILTVSRLASCEKYKGHDVIMDALPRVLKEFQDAHYLIVGTGDDKERLETRMRSSGLEKNVTFAGFIPDEEISAHYNLCDVFAMPSTGEGFGIVFIEAIGCGKPVIAGNKDASVEAVDHGNLGVLVDPTDVEDVARSLIRVLKKEDPDSIIFQPETLRSKVIELFGFDRFKANLKREIDEVLANA